ncbi:helix-turn-helix domain-containing protein, partial [Microbacterium sp.]|uniref:helix-turn-helix domain-containing protein n=1 Tax=Microbacterium sp. TaxID=51671 RepID=UPI003A8BB716
APGLRDLGIVIGVSSLESDPARLHDLVVEARSAARAAQATAPAEIGLFDDLGLTAIGYLFDVADARTIARLVVPDFCAAPDLATLAESVAAFVASGSVTAAAESLGIHRNTLTVRLDRARTLGLPIGDPRSTLAIMALVRAFAPRLGADPASTGQH